MQNLKWAGLALILALMVGYALSKSGLAGRISGDLAKSHDRPVRICVGKSLVYSLILLADEIGYFRSEGVNVDLQLQPLGLNCIEQLTTDQVDFAAAYDRPILVQIEKGVNLSILTELHNSSRYSSIVYSKLSGILTPADLVGKRVGLIPGTSGEFLLQLYCMAHDISCDAIHKVETNLNSIVGILQKGDVDAIVAWEPHVTEALSSAPERFAQLLSPFYAEFSILVANSAYLSQNPQVATKILKSLFRAQEFLERKPLLAKAFALKRLGVPDSPAMEASWSKTHFQLGLSNVFKTIIERELALDEDGSFDAIVREPKKRDIANILAPEFLRQISPESVTYQ